MQVLFRILKQDGLEQQLYDGTLLNILLSELDFVDIEVRTEYFYDPSEIYVVIGNTHFKLDEPLNSQGRFIYRLNLDFLTTILPGDKDAHVHKDLITTEAGGRRICRIFINEIGLSKVFISRDNIETQVANIRVATSKISSENYELVTLYLISAGYFDSNILYKSVIEGSQDDIRNTLLEALRKLQRKLEEWVALLPLFKHNPINKYAERSRVVSYKEGLSLDESSINWLADNISVFKTVSRTNPDMDFLLNARPVKVDNVLFNELHLGSDSYENRIIHGFLLTLKRYVSHLSNQVAMLNPRTRIDNFRDFLIVCFNNLIQQTLKEATDCLQHIYRFYQLELPVSSPISGFPDKVEGFLKKYHYTQVLGIIDYSRRLFNVNIDLNNFSLEVESFDKLFEIYCFYLIKDTLSNLLGNIQWQVSPAATKENKLAGIYTLHHTTLLINLHYENFPEEFRQFADTSSGTGYNPDFILSVKNAGKTSFLILDAKYKNYSRRKLQEDLSHLTLNYLHKIGPVNETHKVIGLFTVSLSPSNNNRCRTIFKHEYSIFSNDRFKISPQIGSIELSPKNLTFQANPLLVPFQMLLDFRS